MKTVKLLILTLVFSNPVLANDNHKEALIKNLRFLKEYYPNYVNSTFEAQVSNYFFFRFQDYAQVMDGLSNMTVQSWNRVIKFSEEWQTIHALLDAGDSADIESYAVDLGRLLSLTEMEARLLEVIHDDYSLLQPLWPSRCSDNNLSYARNFFKPLNLYAPGRIEMKAAGLPITVGVQVSYGYDQKVNVPWLASSKVDTAIIFVSAGIGATIGGVASGPVAPAGAMVGGAVGAGVGCVIVSVKNVAIASCKLEEQNKIIAEIIQFQKDKINELDQRAFGLIEKTCNEFMPGVINHPEKGLISVEETISKNMNITQEAVRVANFHKNKMRREFDALSEKLKIDLKTIVKSKSEAIRKNYIDNVHKVDADLAKVDDLIREDLKKINPTIKHEIWNFLIDGKIKYEPQGKFSRLTLWSQTETFLKKEISK